MRTSSPLVQLDVLVVGAGMAGLYAALAACTAGAQRVAILSRKPLHLSGCSRLTSGVNVPVDDDADVERYSADTMVAGGGINARDLVDRLARETRDRIAELEGWGCTFDRDGLGEYARGTFAGSSRSRSMHILDYTGLEITRTLIRRLRESDVSVLEGFRAVSLLINASGHCCGLKVQHAETQTLSHILAKSTVLATGGGARMFPVTSVSQDKTCDGIAMAYRAGAELRDLEMVQFHPTGLVRPGSRLHGFVLDEELRYQGARLLNGRGEPFMTRYDPAGDRATRDTVSRASFQEIRDGRGTHERAILLDLSGVAEGFLRRRFPRISKRFQQAGAVLGDRPVPVSPTAHFLMGGVRIDHAGRSSIPFLYACGEDAGGCHGANRMGGNGVAEALVFGNVAGRTAAEEGLVRTGVGAPVPVSDRQLAFRGNPRKILSELHEIMWADAGIVRGNASLRRADAALDQLTERALAKGENSHSTAPNAVSTCNLITVAHAIVRSAIARTESLGSHYREDSSPIDGPCFTLTVAAESGPQVRLVPVNPVAAR